MSKLEEFINNFTYDPSVFQPEQFKAAIIAAHKEDIGVWDAKVQGDAERLTSVEKENRDLKIQAWDAMMKGGAPIAPNNASGSQVPPAPEEDPDVPELKGLGSFLTKKEG